jgi:hypothetical protein
MGISIFLQRHIISRHTLRLGGDGQNETIQTTAPTNGSINLFDAGQGNS